MSETFKALKNIPKRGEPTPPPQPKVTPKAQSGKAPRIIVFGGLILAIIGVFSFQYLKEARNKHPAPAATNAVATASLSQKAHKAFMDGKLQEALKLFEAAQMESPKDVAVMINLGRTYKELGQMDQAEAVYKQALNLDPKSPVAWNNLGRLYMDSNKLTQAEETLKKASQLSDDSYADAFINLAVLYEKQNQWTEAYKHYSIGLRRMKDASPDSKQLQHKLKVLQSLAVYEDRGRYGI